MIISIGIGSVLSCAKKTSKSTSVLDNSEYHYNLGIQQLENGDIKLAIKSFNNSKNLTHNFALANVGLALAAITSKEYQAAKEFIQLAKRESRNCAEAYIAEGRLIAHKNIESKKASKLWISDAVKEFQLALRIDKNNPEALFYMGDTYLRTGMLKDAETTFLKILNSDYIIWKKKAREKVRVAQEIERLSPGSTFGKQIGLKEAISRAEMAVLLVEELNITAIFSYTKTGTRPNHHGGELKTIRDTLNSDHWANGWVDIILRLGVPGLSLFPDGNFYHDQKLTRAQCALVISFLVQKLSQNTISHRKYRGSESTFSDLKVDHYAYSAASLSIDLGFLELDDIRTTTFDPSGSITGLEVLSMIRRMQESFRSEF